MEFVRKSLTMLAIFAKPTSKSANHDHSHSSANISKASESCQKPGDPICVHQSQWQNFGQLYFYLTFQNFGSIRWNIVTIDNHLQKFSGV